MLTNFNRELELVDGLETNYLRILYYEFSKRYGDTYKSYEYNRLCTIIEGEKHVSVNNNDRFTYNKNQFLLLPPDSSIYMDIEVPTKALVLELNGYLLKNVSEKVYLDYWVDYDTLIEDKLLFSELTLDIKDVLNRIAITLSKPGKNIEFLLDLYAQELTYNLIQIKGVNQILNLEYNNPINKAIKYIHDNYMSPISIKEISYNLNMSESSFCQYFKKVLGVTPKEYVNSFKLSKAKDMIKHMSVTEAAFNLGYENISHFISLFKSKYGMTPKQYQKNVECDR